MRPPRGSPLRWEKCNCSGQNSPLGPQRWKKYKSCFSQGWTFQKRRVLVCWKNKLLKYGQNSKFQTVAILQSIFISWLVYAFVYAFGLKVCVCIHIEQSKQLDLALCSLSLKRKIVLFCTEFCHHVHTLLFPVWVWSVCKHSTWELCSHKAVNYLQTAPYSGGTDKILMYFVIQLNLLDNQYAFCFIVTQSIWKPIQM